MVLLNYAESKLQTKLMQTGVYKYSVKTKIIEIQDMSTVVLI